MGVVGAMTERFPHAPICQNGVAGAIVNSRQIPPKVGVTGLQHQSGLKNFDRAGELLVAPLDQTIMAQGGRRLSIAPEKRFEVPGRSAQARDQPTDVIKSRQSGRAEIGGQQDWLLDRVDRGTLRPLSFAVETGLLALPGAEPLSGMRKGKRFSARLPL